MESPAPGPPRRSRRVHCTAHEGGYPADRICALGGIDNGSSVDSRHHGTRPRAEEATVAFWWFMVVSQHPSGVLTAATQGPFSTKEQCEWGRKQIAATTGLNLGT